MKFYTPNRSKGFTLVELMVVISIIGILSTIVYANFGNARKTSRDEIRKTSLKELQLAIEFYKAQNGVYPAQGCGSWNTHWAGPGTHPVWGCTSEDYIVGLVPDYIPALPKDPISEYVNGYGFIYRSNGTDYKLMLQWAVEIKFITSFSDEYARCPYTAPACPGAVPPAAAYAVYSAGAAAW